MVIYLSHPVHGTKVAISEGETVADEKNGWSRYNPDTPTEAAPVNELAAPRRGRPPKNASEG
jgi:hypothetical protein